jgi:dTDP-4-dehydrorhamnose 3,5-epimerase
VPPGFANGFYVMSESVDFLYKCTDSYAPEHERSLQWDDPTLAINWPLLNDDAPLLSAKDAQAASWQDAEMFE